MIDAAHVSARDLRTRLYPPRRAGGRIGLHHARGRGRVPGTGAAVLGRQGLHRAAAPGREGLPAGTLPVPADARGHRPQLPGGHRFPGPARRGAGRAADRGLRPGLHRHGSRARGARQPVPQPAPDHHPAGRHPGARLRRRVRRCPAGRGEGTRQGARLLAAGRVRPVGAQVAAARSCGASTTARIRRGQHMRVFPISNWTEMDVWQYIEREHLEVPSIYFAHERDVFRRDSMWLAPSDFLPRGEDEALERMIVRYRTVGDMTCTGAVSSTAATVADDHRGGGRRAHHGARRHPRRRRLLRDVHGRPQARGLLSRWTCCASPPRARSTTARAPSSAGCCSTPRASSRTSTRPSSGPAVGGATARWTWRC